MQARSIVFSVSLLALANCAQSAEQEISSNDEPDVVNAQKVEALVAPDVLAAVLATQSEETKARYAFRHPQETIGFFGVAPGTTILEALPGGGWYSKILLPYLGDDGVLIGVDYSLDMWPRFGTFADDEFMQARQTWAATWIGEAMEWRNGADTEIKAFAFENRDTSLDGSVDTVLFIRALHNLARFEQEGGHLTNALADAHALLKPGGIVGIVQHRAPNGNEDSWADGSNGYLKQDAVIKFMENAGFEFIAASEINANPNDKPTDEDIVWRLPPTFGTSKENPELKVELEAIGESDRMTLKFRKP